ncbi:hypothetical protein ABJ684_001243 [Escherichia coli]|uniref:hypothetical protein n=1 Tax=Escherichia coli TaxID=562 RepID=UPI000C1466DE|nr:hypothetical protein [Escherichia coli]ELO0558591.1 hypothetical protein [Escherichia coli O8]KAE9707943.1 hypothetical protein GP721_05435 [Enterobacteriaceae bacterium TzEc077]EEU0021392.1 hypothetical protein [Escherichia coli]EFB9896362.1 hypothetical protein [Escherichia coli]EFG5616049.1 hypothetical protein [Escherichia coli]
MYFIKATVKRTAEGSAVSETFSDFLGSATIKLAVAEFGEAVKDKFGSDAEFVVEDVKQIF